MEQNRNKQKRPPRDAVKCLCCGQVFLAEGPFLRVCAICKASDEWQSGNCDVALHDVAPHPVAANDNDA